jgi:hypothetical protein
MTPDGALDFQEDAPFSAPEWLTGEPPQICICHPNAQFTNADGSLQSATVQAIIFLRNLLGLIVAAILVLTRAVWFPRWRYRASVLKAVALHRPVGRGDA